MEEHSQKLDLGQLGCRLRKESILHKEFLVVLCDGDAVVLQRSNVLVAADDESEELFGYCHSFDCGDGI